MISRLLVSNFKSIAKEVELPIAPLTIFTGPNSSGKSAFLQSLLIIGQTLSSRVDGQSVALNGTFTRLGKFDELRSYKNDTGQISIGWEYDIPAEDETNAIKRRHFPWIPAFPRMSSDKIKKITCKLSFDADPENPKSLLHQLQPQISLFTMSVTTIDEKNIERVNEIAITRTIDLNKKISSLDIDEPLDEIFRKSLEYDVAFSQDWLDDIRKMYISAEPVGCIFQTFMPYKLVICINNFTEAISNIRKYILSFTNIDIARPSETLPCDVNFILTDAIMDQLKIMFGKKFKNLFTKPNTIVGENSGITILDFGQGILKLKKSLQSELYAILNDWLMRQDITGKTISPELNSFGSENSLCEYGHPLKFYEATEHVIRFFSKSVKYLSPFRDEPTPLYSLAAQADPADIGLKGEMAVTALNINRDKQINYIPSASFYSSPFDTSQVRQTLEKAVTDWLKYLGVAEDAKSIDMGMSGHVLKVSLSKGDPYRDLAHVGVGVSQVLPILVMSLLAENNSTLIFEHPEIHLHPMIQTRLADFFLSLALSGKQCLIETHSEFLINRIRNRVAAEEEDNRVVKNLKLYFVQKTDGASSFREVKCNEYGAIPDWPKGFFDQTHSELASILRFATAKRERLKG
jgi:predicted ATPase